LQETKITVTEVS